MTESRRESLIFRGVKAESTAAALESIKSITHSFLNLTPPLSNLHCVSRDKGLYRVKLTDDELHG